MSIEEARKQKNKGRGDENDLTRALLASMGSMGESLALAAQAFQQQSGGLDAGMGGSLAMAQQQAAAGGSTPKLEDIPSCSKVPDGHSAHLTQGCTRYDARTLWSSEHIKKSNCPSSHP